MADNFTNSTSVPVDMDRELLKAALKSLDITPTKVRDGYKIDYPNLDVFVGSITEDGAKQLFYRSALDDFDFYRQWEKDGTLGGDYPQILKKMRDLIEQEKGRRQQ